MTAGFDPGSFAASLGLRWTRGPTRDVHRDFVEVRGEVESLPSRETVETVLSEAGFSPAPPRTTSLVAADWTATRGAERLRLTLLPGLDRGGRVIHGLRVSMVWSSGQRPPVDGGWDWQGRSWPAFFDRPTVYHESASLLILEGHVPASGFASVAARYDEWAKGSGFAKHRLEEPDLGGDLVVADRAFTVTLKDRGRHVTLSATRRVDADTDE